LLVICFLSPQNGVHEEQPLVRTSRQTLPVRTFGSLGLSLLVAGAVLLARPTGANSQTCTPTPPIPPPSPSCTPFNYTDCGPVDNEDNETLPFSSPAPVEATTGFQPPDGTKLRWRRYFPDGQRPWPTIILVHGGGFHSGSPRQGSVDGVATDLAAAGYYVLSVTYRLAPDHSHPESGRPPEQTDDIKSLIRAARADTTNCNGRIGVVGGSAGGAHAIWVSLDKTPTPGNNYPHWCQNGADDRPDCAVSCSGPFDLSDREGATDDNQDYVQNVENYTNTCVRVDPNGGYDQKSVSVVSQVKSESAQSFKPILVFNSVGDSMPLHQTEDLRCALASKSIDTTKYKITIIPGMGHSFGYWDHKDGVGSNTRVHDDVIAFLDVHLKN
jgi:acetyl esterase/lipase